MNYQVTKSVDEAMRLLSDGRGTARIIAGGTDLMIAIRNMKTEEKPKMFVDVAEIPELNQIEVVGDYLHVGASAKLSTISDSPIVKKHAPSLAEAARVVGCLQISNIATLAGNIVTAQPAADAAMGLAPLDPIIEVLSSSGKRELKMNELYAGFAKSHIDSTKEIVTKIRIPCRKDDEMSKFIRLVQRSTFALPMLNCAVMVKVVDGKFKWVRIYMAPVGVGPVQAKVAEDWLAGKVVNKDNIAEGAALVLENANPRSNPLRGSREYRLTTLPVITKRALFSAVEKLGVVL